MPENTKSGETNLESNRSNGVRRWICERIRIFLFNYSLNIGCTALIILIFLLIHGWERVQLDIQSLILPSLPIQIRLDPKDSVVDEAGRMTWMVTPNLCPSAPPSQLHDGDRAIQMQPGGINLRREPDIRDETNRIRKIAKCELVTIIDGPKCVDGYNLYKVRPDGSQEGWAAESEKTRMKYWLVPMLDNKKCNLPPIFVPTDVAISDHPFSGYVRENPAISATKLPWSIYKGDTVTILDGPICNDSYIWYKVHGARHSDPGWTELGRGNDYFFEIPSRFASTNDETADASCPANP